MEDNSNLITIRIFASESEAEITKSALEAFGIDCMISRDDCVGQRPHLSMGEGIRLVIRSARWSCSKRQSGNLSAIRQKAKAAACASAERL